MCCICVAIDKKPTLDQIHKMYDDNSHGASISFINKEGLAEYKKGLNEDEVFKAVYETPLPFVLHFRQSSFWKDRENKLLNHPFEISINSPLKLEGKAEKLLIHNGTIKEYELMMAVADIPIIKDDMMTDSRAIAMIMAKNKDEKLPWRIPGKFVIIDSTRSKGKFRLSGDFTLEDGIMFSNLSWKWGTKTYNNSCSGLTEDEYYNYLINGDLPSSFELDEKKKIIKKGTEIAKKTTQKIKLQKKTEQCNLFKLDDTMTEQQYNAGIYYRKPKTKNTQDIDIVGNQSEYLKAGMKERRKWWWGFYRIYGDNLYYQQRNLDISNAPTKYQCNHCKGYLPFYRVNALRLIGFNPNEFLCKTCEGFSKNMPSFDTRLVDNFKSKTTRLLPFCYHT
jgi:hypothetical protein